MFCIFIGMVVIFYFGWWIAGMVCIIVGLMEQMTRGGED